MRQTERTDSSGAIDIARANTPHAHFTQALLLGAIAVLLVFAWQAITVRVNYEGNWTGLFRIGAETSLPDALSAGAFRNPHPIGYDGQYYRLLAHDPILRNGWAAYLDEPILRSRRILVPALAWALAFGRQGLIDYSYVFVVLGCIFLGTHWLTRILVAQGRHPAWGLSFLAVPAVLVAVDSMTIDVAIAALAAGFAWHLRTGRAFALWLILAAAGFVRETGLIFAAACVLASGYQRDWRKALLWASAALPTFVWYVCLQAVLGGIGGEPESGVPSWAIPQLEFGILARMVDPVSYPDFSPRLRTVARILDELAMAGMLGIAVLTAVRLRYIRPMAQKIMLGLQVLLVVAMTSKGFWVSAYSFSRPFAPLFLLPLASDRPKTALLLALLVDLRVLAEYYSQALRVLHWLFGG